MFLACKRTASNYVPTRFNLITLVSEVIIDQYAQVPNRTILLESSEEEIAEQ
jgi:hypothetical protein